MTEKDKEIQELCRELRLAKAEIDRIREQRDTYWEQLEYQLKEEPKMKLRIMLEEKAKKPVRGHEDDAGLDLKSAETKWVHPGCHELFDTGVHVAIEKGYYGQVASKSGLMLKGLTARGVIDSSYRGSIGVVLYNHSDEGYLVTEGDKIAQLLILPVVIPEIEYVESLDETDRGSGGFGSTGK